MIPEELKKLDHWAIAKDNTKRPYNPNSLEIKKDWELLSREETATYEKCLAIVADPTNDFTRLGLSLETEDKITVIDIDGGFDEYGIPTDYLIDCMNTIKGYTEYSTLHHGIHIFVKSDYILNIPFLLTYSSKYRGQIETGGGNWVLINGETIIDVPIEMNNEGVKYFLQTYGAEGLKAKGYFKQYYDLDYKKPHEQVISLEDENYPTIIQGARQLSLLNYAGHLIKDGINNKDALNNMYLLNEKKCVPSLTETEVKEIYKDAKKRIKGGKNE